MHIPQAKCENGFSGKFNHFHSMAFIFALYRLRLIWIEQEKKAKQTNGIQFDYKPSMRKAHKNKWLLIFEYDNERYKFQIITKIMLIFKAIWFLLHSESETYASREELFCFGSISVSVFAFPPPDAFYA